MLTDKFWAMAGEAEYPDVERFLTKMATERFTDESGTFLDRVALHLDKLRNSDQSPILFQQVAVFMEEVGEPPPMFAEGLIPEKSFVLWTGKAKFGKSLACYQLMTDVATGCDIFGHFKTNKPGPVLYIGMEDGKHEVNRRLRNFGLTTEDKAIPIFVNTDLRDYGKSENVQALREAVGAMEVPPVLIVIDTLTESLDGVRDWNNRNEIKRAFRALRGFAQEVCTVVGIIHNVKGNAEERDSGDEVAGSLAVLSSVDGYLSCYKRRRLSDGNLQLFVRGGGRGGISSDEFVIEMDTETYHWRWLDTDEVEAAKRAEQIDARKAQWGKVEAAVKWKENSATVKEIAEHSGLSEPYTRALVSEMVKADRLEKTGMVKSNGAGKPAPSYGLPSPNNNNETIISFNRSVIIPDADEAAKQRVDAFMDAPDSTVTEYDIE